MARSAAPGAAEKFCKNLSALCPAWWRERFVLAFSGGLDSTALLLLALAVLPPEQITSAHLNHSLRGEAADADQRFAASLAAEKGVAFITAKEDVAALARVRGKGLEEAARRARYIFLEEAARAAGARYILTAHQADDQLETVLMNVIRGAGAGGLAGIHPRRSSGAFTILRPLLDFSREELRAVLTAAGQGWVEDATNRDVRYRRNALRLDIIPQLKNINPRLLEAVGRSSAVLRAEEDFWRNHLQKLWPRIVAADDAESTTLHLKRPELAALSLAERRRFIYEAFLRLKQRAAKAESGEPLALATVETVLAMLDFPQHKGLDLPGGLRAEVLREVLKLSSASRFMYSLGT